MNYHIISAWFGPSFTDPTIYSAYRIHYINHTAKYGLPSVMGDVQCTSHETQLSQCNYTDTLSYWCHTIYRVRCQLIKGSKFCAYIHTTVAAKGIPCICYAYRYCWCTSECCSFKHYIIYDYPYVVSSPCIRNTWADFFQLHHQLLNRSKFAGQHCQDYGCSLCNSI